ncbi:hypothetical protein [Enterococcus sp. LJL90]
MTKKYQVLHDFKDLQDDKQRIYRKGDFYEGKPSEGRLAELTTKNNAIKEILIAEVSDKKLPEELEAAGVADDLKDAEEFPAELGVEYDGEGIKPDPAAEPAEKPKAKGKKAKAE